MTDINYKQQRRVRRILKLLLALLHPLIRYTFKFKQLIYLILQFPVRIIYYITNIAEKSSRCLIIIQQQFIHYKRVYPTVVTTVSLKKLHLNNYAIQENIVYNNLNICVYVFHFSRSLDFQIKVSVALSLCNYNKS